MPQVTGEGPNRAQALCLCVLLAGAAAVGTWAVTSTQRIGSQATKPEVASDLALQRRSRQLDAWRASLDRALRAKPPALPRVPRYAPVPRIPVVQQAPLPAFVAPARRTTAGKAPATPVSATTPTTHRRRRPPSMTTTTTPSPVPAASNGGGDGGSWTGNDD